METKKEVEHHKQQNLCTNRPLYRQGRRLTAVKVYTVNSESQHLFIYNVPKINLRNELKSLCSKYGTLLNLHVVSDHKTELFTECYHAHFERIQSARIAKRLMDNKSFYGGVLHVCYAPEYETSEETCKKLHQRQRDVMSRLLKDSENLISASRKEERVPKRKRETEEEITEQPTDSLEDIFTPIYFPDDPILNRESDKDKSLVASRSVQVNRENSTEYQLKRVSLKRFVNKF